MGIFLAGGVAGQEPRLVLPVGHTGVVNSCRFSPNGKYLLTSSYDKTVRLWQTLDGRLVNSYLGHNSWVNDAEFSPDGKKIVSASEDKTVRVWELFTGLPKGLLKFNTSVQSAMFDKTGNKLLVCTRYDTAVRIWDINTGKPETSFNIYTGELGMAVFSSDYRLVAAENDDKVCVWDLSTQKILFEKQFPEIITKVAISPDNKKIIVSSWDNTAKLFDIETGRMLLNLAGHSKFVSSAVFSNDGKYIATSSQDKTGILWDAVQGVSLLTWKLDIDGLSDVAISANNKMIAFSSLRNKIYLKGLGSNNRKLEMRGYSNEMTDAVFVDENKQIITLPEYGIMRRWDAREGKLLEIFPDSIIDGRGLVTTKDGKQFATANKGKIMIGTARIGPLRVLPYTTEFLSIVSFAPSGEEIAESSRKGLFKRIDLNTGMQLGQVEDRGIFFCTSYSPDGNYVAIGGTGSLLDATQIREVKGLNLIRTLEGHTNLISCLDFSPDGSKLLTGSEDSTVIVWDWKNGKAQQTWKAHTDWVTAVLFIDDQTILTAGKENSLKLWTTEGKLLRTMEGHIDDINSVKLSADRKFIISTSMDQTCKVWDLSTGKLIYTLLSIDQTDYIVFLPSGYYMATPNASKKLHYVTSNLRVITFEQLDIRFNRPDKILEALGNTDISLIRSYRRAWEKRIKKLGIDTTQFRDGYSVPECDFANRDQIEAEQKTETLRLHIKASDSTYLLDRFNIWINESPLFGQRGIRTRKNNSYSLDTIITIKLSQGENRIECSITNVNGTESYRMPLYVNYTPAIKQKESLRFIGIGIDRFSEKGHDLQYSVKDIRDLSAKLKEKYGNDIQIDTLFNENVNSINVQALKNQLHQTSVNDKVILAYSGHGLLSKDFDYYLSTYTVNFNQPEQNGLPYEELENLLDSIPARSKLMLIDACHSGEVDKEEMTRISNVSDSLQQQGTKGGKPTFTGKTTLGMKNSFELMQALFVNVGKSTGATVISAAAGTQFALERGDLKNGVFTYSILEALNKYPSIKISELRKIVGERVEQLTNGLQKPTSRNETIATDWTL